MTPQRSSKGTAARRVPEMTSMERVSAAVDGEEVDRMPVCFWHHFKPAGNGRALAAATVDFFVDEFDLDIVKIMPDLPYPFPKKSIRTLDDWYLIEPIHPEARNTVQRAIAVSQTRGMVGYEKPVIYTLFSPMCEALYAAESHETFLRHASESPHVIHEALSTLALNIRQQVENAIVAGADGVFFALQGCTRSIMSEEMYREFGRPYDLLALQPTANSWLNVLHIHGEKELMFDTVLDYPVQVLSWSDRLAGPSLREARALTSKCLMGGWHEFGPLSNGPTSEIENEARDVIAQTKGRKVILANGCSVPDETDHRWLSEGRRIAELLKL